MYIGSWKIDDLVTFSVTTHTASTGAATDADSVPSYRVYEDETGTAILTGNMAKLDDANTTGFYSEQITLSAANGFEKGKSYNIIVSATVGGIAGNTLRTFQLEAEVDANVVSGNVTVGALATAAKAEVQTEAEDALRTYHLDHLIPISNTIAASPSSTTTELYLSTGYLSTDFVGSVAFIPNATIGDHEARRIIAQPATNRITLDRALTSAPSSGDEVLILPALYLQVLTSALADGVITASKIATDAITADKIAADAIGASELAAGAVAEIADAVLDEALSGHTTAGTLGDAILRILGLSNHNAVMDDETYDASNNLTDATLYLYDSAANATTHDKATGLIGTYTISATVSSNNVTLFKQIKAS